MYTEFQWLVIAESQPQDFAIIESLFSPSSIYLREILLWLLIH